MGENRYTNCEILEEFDATTIHDLVVIAVCEIDEKNVENRMSRVLPRFNSIALDT